MTTLEATKEALSSVRERLALALEADKAPWTAISSLTKQETDLALRVADLECAEGEIREVDEEEIRAGILALPDHLVEVASEALDERRAAGGPVVA